MTSTLTLLAQQSGGGTAVAAGGGFIFVLIIGIVILTSIFWLWMLIDCLSSSLPSTEKLIWVLVIVFLHILGAILYFLLARGKRSTT